MSEFLGELYTQMPIGSHLYGTATAQSDRDTLKIYKAPLHQVVSNVRRTMPSTITEQDDTRRSYLHDFVMGLGENPENTLFYLHYMDLFPGLDPDWVLTLHTAEKMFESGRSMMLKADVVPPKQLGHAWRYMYGAQALLVTGNHEYPLTGYALEVYQDLRAGEPPSEVPTWDDVLGAANQIVLPDRERNLDQMALWVLEQYVEARVWLYDQAEIVLK